jgi:hypothetical protein
MKYIFIEHLFMNELIAYLRTLKVTPINVTHKIKDEKSWDVYMTPRRQKCVFIIKKNKKTEFVFGEFPANRYHTNFMLTTKKRILYITLEKHITDNLKRIIERLVVNNTDCDICIEENKIVRYCTTCNYGSCLECLEKIKKDNIVICPQCRQKLIL